MKRRTLLKNTVFAAPLALGAFSMDSSSAANRGLKFKNDDFYKNGEFDVEKGKDAVMALCRHMNYPIFPTLRDQLWVSDYGTGQFADLGLAACLFQNHAEDGTYMMLDIFLLPNQMLPEHWHLKGDLGITKNEGWLVRWGKSYIAGIGDDNLDEFPDIRIPKCHCNGTTTTRHVVAATPGMFVPLAKVETRHWQYGGPEGAIVTEVANYHTNSAVRHSDKAINDAFLNG